MNYITRSVVSWQEDQERKLKEVKKDNASAKNIQPLLKFLYFYEYSFEKKGTNLLKYILANKRSEEK